MQIHRKSTTNIKKCRRPKTQEEKDRSFQEEMRENKWYGTKEPALGPDQRDPRSRRAQRISKLFVLYQRKNAIVDCDDFLRRGELSQILVSGAVNYRENVLKQSVLLPVATRISEKWRRKLPEFILTGQLIPPFLKISNIYINFFVIE